MNSCERLAARIRVSLGEYNDPDKPVQWLVEKLVERLAAAEKRERDVSVRTLETVLRMTCPVSGPIIGDDNSRAALKDIMGRLQSGAMKVVVLDSLLRNQKDTQS